MNDKLKDNQSKATQSLVDLWHKGVTDRDGGLLYSLFSKAAELSTPFSSDPFIGVEAILRTLKAFDQSVEQFRYVKSMIQDDVACLFFEGRIQGEFLQGVDVIRIDSEGKIVSFEVMARPLQAIQKLHDSIESISKNN